MFTRPPEITDDALAARLHASWGHDVHTLDYRAVGFGSHHWHLRDAQGGEWFVTVDDLARRLRDAADTLAGAHDRLRAALRTGRAARDIGGLEFVVAPVPSRDGDVVSALSERFVVAVYPHLQARSHGYHDRLAEGDQRDVVDLLARLHALDATVHAEARVDCFDLDNRDDLKRALQSLDIPWRLGPFGEQARQLLADQADHVQALLRAYDALAASDEALAAPKVLTHGEPHPANWMNSEPGWHLIDWDTALLAPVERDAWMLVERHPSMRELFDERSRAGLHTTLLELYRLRWALTDIGGYLGEFLREHERSADMEESFANLTHYVTSTPVTA